MNKNEIKTFIKTSTPLILDIGCYDGKDSAEFNLLFNNNCEIHCFEANPSAIDKYKNANRSTNLHLHEIAISNIDGIIDFNIAETHSSSTKTPKNHLKLFPHVKFNSSVQCNCKKLDTWYEENIKNKIIDFIWADVNGAEEELILGGINTLKRYTRYIYTEYSDVELYSNQINKSKLLDLLLPEFTCIGEYDVKNTHGNILCKNTML